MLLSVNSNNNYINQSWQSMIAKITPATIRFEHASARSSAMRIVKALPADRIPPLFGAHLRQLNSMPVFILSPVSGSAQAFRLIAQIGLALSASRRSIFVCCLALMAGAAVSILGRMLRKLSPGSAVAAAGVGFHGIALPISAAPRTMARLQAAYRSSPCLVLVSLRSS